MFWANLPIALVIGAGVLRRPIAADGRRVAGIDLAGALLFTSPRRRSGPGSPSRIRPSRRES
jgi:hypothetical protein